MHRIALNGLNYYEFDSLAAAGGMRHGVFTRLGGVSPAPYASLNVGSTVGDDPGRVLQNRARAASALGLRDEDVRTTWQVHSADVVIVRRGEKQPYPPPRADVILTPDAGVPLTMRFADCAPILLYDPVRHALGMVHAGWRGTAMRAAQAAVETMRDAFGSRPADLLAGIGPAIGPDHYEVGPEVVRAIHKAFTQADRLLHPTERPGHARLDLWEANRQVLEDAGVQEVEVSGLCTFTHVDQFFSHRAEHGKTGRFGMIAMLEERG